MDWRERKREGEADSVWGKRTGSILRLGNGQLAFAKLTSPLSINDSPFLAFFFYFSSQFILLVSSHD